MGSYFLDTENRISGHKIRKFREYAKLLRLYALPVYCIIPIIGLLTVRDITSISIGHIFILLIVGALTIIYGHVLNEYTDLHVDRLSAALSKKPLVSGVIPRWHALVISFFSLLGAIILSCFYFNDLFVFTLLLIALILAGLYNILHKKIPGSDLFIAGAVFFFFLFGAATASHHFGHLTYIIGGLLFLRELIANSIESALKDIEHEYKVGIKTMPVLLGVRVNGDKLTITKKFWAYAVGLEMIFMAMLIFAIYLFRFNNLLWITIFLILALALFYTKFGYLDMKFFQREKLKKKIGVHEMVVFTCLIAVFLIFIGVAAALIAAISVICSILSMFVVYGTSPTI
ncbi:MAG: UbiA family prenyltransferase [Methanomassiliicoccales archaeon]|nr:MAG: UbiA family prenyltransferase [Methanomassiliicoccales archaeon]